MRNDINFEQIRETVLLLQKAIETHDAVTEAIVDNRIKFEALKRMPELGNGQRGTVTSADVKQAIDGLRKQQSEHAAIINYLASTETVDDARQVYLNLITAFQRVGTLRELERMVIAGFPSAIKEVRESFQIDTDNVSDLAEVVAHQESLALDHLGAVSAIDIPAISEIALPGIRLSR